MREIDSGLITEAVARLCEESNYHLPPDVEHALRARAADEPWEPARCVLKTICENIDTAAAGRFPLCQDTGMVTVWIYVGQDAHIAGFILEAWKSAVVLVNKWDVVEKDNDTMNQFTAKVRKDLNFMDYVPILFISAKTGQRVDQVLPLALRVQEERLARVNTGSLNRILHKAQDMHAPTSRTGTSIKLYYGTQVRSDPPTFMIYCNNPKLAHFTYLRFLENQIRKEYPFTGTPIRLVLKPRHD